MRRLLRVARAVTGPLTPTGRSVAALGGGCLTLSTVTAFHELRVLGWMCLVLLALAVPWLLLPARVGGRLTSQPPRAVAGESVRAVVALSHQGGLPILQPLVRLPVGSSTTWLRLASLRSGATRSGSLTVETARRGVLPVGPVHLVRSDPLGLMAVHRPLTPTVELYVRPVIVPLASLGVGDVRDVEGVPSDRMSMSDLAFHALREYVRGDDLRHVHWRSSARAGELLVRQYHESRRNQTTVVVDTAPTSYGEGDGFELAASVAASLIVCADREDHVLSLVAGTERLWNRPAPELLDGLCRMEQEGGRLAADVATAVAEAPDASVLLVVTGDQVAIDEVSGSLWVAPADTRCVVLRVVPGAPAARTLHQGRDVLTVGSLGDLPALLSGAR